jgi:3-oxoacyl-[acyl-carrier protein] reductase
MDSCDLNDRVALVTGASRGIGQAIALRLAQAGAEVIGTATSASGAEKIRAMFTDGKLTGDGRVVDVADPNSIEQLLSGLKDTGKEPLVLVNNAGITRDNLLLRMKDEEWDAVINTNLTSVFRLCRAMLRPMLKARYGRIINIGSVVGASGNPGQSNYTASKAGLVGFTKSLAREVGARGITVNTVAPGYIATDMTEALPAEQREALIGNIALGRLGTAQDVAAAVLFLASEGAGYITGETLHVNGGMYMV